MYIFSRKNILCFSKFKCFPLLSLPSPPPSSPSSKHTQNPESPKTLINNSNSLYDLSSASTSTSNSSCNHSSDDYTDDSPPDLATVFASQRFFFSSPGNSNSIFHSHSSPPNTNKTLLAGSVAVQTYSPDPFHDFRNSMQEMLEARELKNLKTDWDFLHELLLCYLTLNPKDTHKFIINAFCDLVISRMSS